MSGPIRIWVEASHHRAFACGGWAFVRQDGQSLTGKAGGQRATNAERNALSGLAAALEGLPAGAAVTVASANPVILGVQRRLLDLKAGRDALTDDLDLWAQLAAALRENPATITASAPQPKTPAAFAAAWAELARDKAKSIGGFQAIIPKPNLAKAGVT
jgi:hypothetical protein